MITSTSFPQYCKLCSFEVVKLWAKDEIIITSAHVSALYWTQNLVRRLSYIERFFFPRKQSSHLNGCQICASVQRVSCRPGWVWLGVLREACRLHFGNGLFICIAALHPCGPRSLRCNAVCRNECISKLDEFFFHYFLLLIPEYRFGCDGPWTWPCLCWSMSIISSSSAFPRPSELSMAAFSSRDSRDLKIHTWHVSWMVRLGK